MNNSLVILEEQGLRDGIQNLSQLIPIAQKLAYVNALVDAGIKRIQIASFVHPRLVPQMADAEELCKAIHRKDDVIYSGLVLNLRGVERAIDAGLDHIACSLSASDTHSQKNARKTLAQAQSAFAKMVKLCRQHHVTARGGIQCAFGCRYEGIIQKEHVLDMVKSHLDTGIQELALADSTGMANPKDLQELMSQVVELAGEVPVILHLHNTENKGYANVFAALLAGVRIFDTAFGGLGGCPFIESASGNIATEDTVNMLNQMGYETGIDMKKIAAISMKMQSFLNQELQGKMYTLLNTDGIEMI